MLCGFGLKKEKTVLEQVISKIDSNEIMVLSRNNNDIKRYLNKNLKLNENKLISFSKKKIERLLG